MSLRITLTVAEARQVIHMVRWLDGGDDGAEPDYDLADRLCDEIGKPRPAWLNDPRPHDSEDTPMATGCPSPGYPGITVVAVPIVDAINEAKAAQAAQAARAHDDQLRDMLTDDAYRRIKDAEAEADRRLICGDDGPRHRDYNAMRGALADPVTHLADGHVTRHSHTIRATAHGHDAVIDGDPPLQADHQPGRTRSGRLAAVVFRTPGWTGPATAEVHIDDPARPVVTIPDVPEHHARHALDYIGHRVLVQDVNDGTRDLILGGTTRPDDDSNRDALKAAEARAATAAADNARLRRTLALIVWLAADMAMDDEEARERILRAADSCPHGYPDPEGHDLNPATGPCHTCGPAIAEARDRRHAANAEAARPEATASTTPRYTVDRIDTPTDRCYVVRDPHGSNVATFDDRHLADTYAAGLDRLARP